VGERNIGLGVLGCGRFARFAVERFRRVPGVRLVAVADVDPAAARAAGERFGVPHATGMAALLERPDVHLVYIATPPFLHHPQAMEALLAGRHVICEKPLALTLDQADEMIRTARERDLLLVANLMQRYNPLFRSVRAIVDSRILGEPLRGCFENYATDEDLPAGHWFWDRTRSGGVFVEHGVHFFDLFEGWFGPGRVEAAQRVLRPGTEMEEAVQCGVRYGGSVLVSFYHGFHQPRRMERQEMRLVFERGEVVLYEWVPTRLRLVALADEGAARRLHALFPSARIEVTRTFPPADRSCTGRHKPIHADGVLELSAGGTVTKMERYGELLEDFLADQVAWLLDAGHPRTVTEEHGRRSLAAALEADRLAGG